jgi:hypothetical protein
VQRSSVMAPLASFTILVALDDARVFEAHFAARLQAEILRRRHLGEIIVLDVNLAGEGDLAGGGRLVLRVVGGVALDDSPGARLVSTTLIGFSTARRRSGGVEFLADGVLENGDVGDAVELGHADPGDEARSALAGMPRRRRPEIVGMRGSSQPVTMPCPDEVEQLALADERVAEVELGEFVLVRERAGQIECSSVQS